ncbi:MAG: putative sulfate/molybdate transporter [Myxococcota bacterium]
MIFQALGKLRGSGPMRFNLAEASGAMGDLGTFIPLTISLVTLCRLDLVSVLFFAGLYNILTGVLFNQPVPVQPMKAIAAVAIAETLSPGSIAAAGLGAGAVVFFLGVTGLIQVVERWVPHPVVRGIQLGVGLKLLVKGIAMIHATPWGALDGPLLAAAAAALIIATARASLFPSALVVFTAGIGVMVLARPEIFSGLTPGWPGLSLTLPAAAEWGEGLLRGTVPQLPLTILNSVIAVCALSGDLYPGRGIGTRPMALSVGLMNLTGCWFGAMPMCHGAGGLAGQHRFGARTGGSVVMLGAAKIGVALLLGSGAAALLAAYPMSILGVLLCFAGVELSLPARDCRTRERFFLAVITAGGCLGFNTAVGFALGIAAALLLRLFRGKDG